MSVTVIFSLVNYFISQLAMSAIELDLEHQSLYPYCGNLFGYEWHDASSRVVNSLESEIQYPWVVLIIRNHKALLKDTDNIEETVMEEFMCSGTVIGDKHVVTAAHCTCPLKKKDPDAETHPHEKALCKSYDKNQITPGYNEIKIYGGLMNFDDLQSDNNRKNTFTISFAYIMDGALDNDGDSDEWNGKDDIGVLITENPMFNKKQLEETNPTDRPPILPICLAAKNSDLNNEKIMGVGWGLIYDESPESDSTEDPYYSSCMTNEAGPDEWIFNHCDMQFIKNNNWSCEKRNIQP